MYKSNFESMQVTLLKIIVTNSQEKKHHTKKTY